MLNALSHAAAGLEDAFARVDAAGERMARRSAKPDDMADLLEARRQFGANAVVVRTADTMIGTLLDVLA